MSVQSSHRTGATPLFQQLLDPATRADPNPVYRRFLSESPVSISPLGSVVLARHRDCAAVLRDRRVGKDERRSTVMQQAIAAGQVDADEVARLDDRPFLFRDPPDHTRLRGLVNRAFTPRVVEALRPTVQRWVDELIDACGRRGELELVADLAYPLPVRVICALLGVPVADHELFRGWSADLARSVDPRSTLPEGMAQRVPVAINELGAYLDGLVARRRRRPEDDLLSALIAAQDAGDQLTATELRATCTMLLIAGHETTVHLITNGMLALLRNPDQLDRLRSDPALASTTVEEVLRFDPPSQIVRRYALEPIVVAGTAVAEGQQLMLLLAAANRDPAVFAEPDRFDAGRAPNPHLAFGAGIHFCIGGPLARMEAQIALAGLARRLVDPALTCDPPAYRENVFLRGPAALDVAFTAVRPA